MKPELIDHVKKFLIEGQFTADIRDYLLNAGAKPKDLEALFQAAWDSILIDAEISQEKKKAWCYGALVDLYRKMSATGDYAGAKSAVKELANLFDLKQTENQQSATTKKGPSVDNVSWPKFTKTKTSRRNS